MTKYRTVLFAFFLLQLISCVQKDNNSKNEVSEEVKAHRVIYEGEEGIGKGKNIVFISTDHEYRGEETLPALAKIMAKTYGFNSTVIWALDSMGYIFPGGSSIKGLETLESADLMVIFTRFSDFSDSQMQAIDNYLERGGPVVGLRTSTHAFRTKNEKWKKYDFRYDGLDSLWKDGFGEVVLGETWVGHYGRNHHQSSILIPEQENIGHPILRGVKDVWVQSGGYKAFPEGDNLKVLARGRILNGMAETAEPDTTKEEMPVAWTRNYKVSEEGKVGRSFATTHGASEDFLNEGFRRMLVNACLWALNLEDGIKAANNVEFVGPYIPTTFNFDGYKVKVKPSDLAGFESLIMPGEIMKKTK